MQIIEPKKPEPSLENTTEEVPEWIHQIEEKTHHSPNSKTKISFRYFLVPLVVLLVGAVAVFGMKKGLIPLPMAQSKSSLKNIILNNYNELKSFSFEGQLKFEQADQIINLKTTGKWDGSKGTENPAGDLSATLNITDKEDNNILAGNIVFLEKELFTRLQHADEFSLFVINMITQSNIKANNTWYKINYSSLDLESMIGVKTPESLDKTKPEILVLSKEQEEIIDFMQTKSTRLGKTNLPNNAKTGETIEIRLTREDSVYLEKLISPEKTQTISEDQDYIIRLWLDKNSLLEGFQFTAINSLTKNINLDLWLVISNKNQAVDIIKPENILDPKIQLEKEENEIISIEESLRMFENGEITEDEFFDNLSRTTPYFPSSEEIKGYKAEDANLELLATITGFRSYAELYGDKNAGYNGTIDYRGVSKEMKKELQKKQVYMELFFDPQKIIAKDSQDAYVFSYPLQNNKNNNQIEYFCIDSTGNYTFVKNAPVNRLSCI